MSTLTFAALLVGLLVFVGACGIPLQSARGGSPGVTPAAATGSIDVAAIADYGYQPDTFQQVPIAADITVTFTEDDVLQHSFTISSREGFVIPTSYTTTQLAQLFVTYPPLYSSMVNPDGPPVVGHFESPAAPGWYEFVCNVSGHFQEGMYGFIAFGENLPSNLSPPSRVGVGGVNINPFLAASIGGLLLVVVVAFVLWRRSRPPRRSSPSPAARSRPAPSGGPAASRGPTSPGR
jgi:plastocyanin